MSTNSKITRIVSKLAWTLTGAKSTSHREKMTKITRKVAWTLLGATGGGASPLYKVLHYREARDEFSGDEYVHKVGPAYIEPQWGYIITPQHQLLDAAIQVNHADYVTWRQGIPPCE